MRSVLLSYDRQARWTALLLMGLLMGLLAGCGSGASKIPDLGETAQVTGTVTLDGKPYPDVNVKFHPLDAKGFQGATGMTDAEGKYDLSMIVGVKDRKPGVVPSKYKVTVSRWRLSDDRPMSEAKENPMMEGAHETAPKATSDPNTTLLWYEVPAAGGTYDIPLNSK